MSRGRIGSQWRLLQWQKHLEATRLPAADARGATATTPGGR